MELAGFRSAGLNVTGVAPGAPWQHILEGCRAVHVFGSGGSALWDAFLADLREHPEKARRPHPLDGFVHDVLRSQDPAPAPSRRWVRCAADSDVFVDFRALAVAAGLGWRSPLGLVLHPTWGPWLGLRLACFTTEADAPTPRVGEGPCPTCPAPCIAACPGDAVSREPFLLDRCLQTRSGAGCLSGCHSRLACPIGSAYPAAERLYHQDPISRIRALRTALSDPEQTPRRRE